MKVLIVEDNPGIAELISEKLIGHGFHPLVAASGSQAIECFVKFQPAIILMDYYLPDMEGQQVILALKEKTNQLPPIIIVTAQDSQSLGELLPHNGIKGYLVKDTHLMTRLPEVLNQLREDLIRKTI
jgi:DNA-binding response OmpR family regulator